MQSRQQTFRDGSWEIVMHWDRKDRVTIDCKAEIDGFGISVRSKETAHRYANQVDVEMDAPNGMHIQLPPRRFNGGATSALGPQACAARYVERTIRNITDERPKHYVECVIIEGNY